MPSRHQSTIWAIFWGFTLTPAIVLFTPSSLARPLLFLWLLVLASVLLRLWMRRGRYVVFVYSNSPNWQPYIESEILPQLPEHTAILNWSERAEWPLWSTAVWAATILGGYREFNPLGIVFPRFRFPNVFRFWRAFKAYKHGKPTLLASVEQRFLRAAGPGPSVALCEEDPRGGGFSWTGPRARAVALRIFVELARRLEQQDSVERLRLEGQIGDPIDVATIDDFVEQAPLLLQRIYCEFAFEFRINDGERAYELRHLDQSVGGMWFETPVEGEPFWETLGEVLRDFQATSKYVRVSGGPWYEDATPFRDG